MLASGFHFRRNRLGRAAAVLGALVFLASSALAQFTVVTGTVTDPNGVPYAYATIAPLLITSATPTITATGALYFPPAQASGLDSTGHFLVRIADNTLLTPAGTKWNFTVCSAVGTVPFSFGTGPQCFTLAAPITISGATQDIGAALHAVAPALTLAFGGGGSVGGSGTANSIPIWTAGTTLGNSNVTQNGVGSSSTVQILTVGGVTNEPLITTNNPTSTCNVTTTTLPFISVQTGGGQGCFAGAFKYSASNNPGGLTGTAAGFFSNDSLANSAALMMGLYSVSGTAASGGSVATSNLGIYGRAEVSVGGGATTNQGIFGFANGGNSGTTATNDGIAAQTATQGATITNDSSLHILSPALSGAGVLTNHTGLKIEDQAVTGAGTNSNPVAIQTFGLAPSKFGGLAVPPVAALASLPSCTAGTEGGHAVATNCNAGCSVGGTCTAGGATHCELYCGGGAAYVETGR